jgi:hypothetical protein
MFQILSVKLKSTDIIGYDTFFFPRGSTVLEGPWPPHI